MRTVGLILLGGKGNRLKNDLPKQFIKVNNKMICEYSIETFSKSDDIDEICICCIDGYDDIYDELMTKYPKIKYRAKGGSERQYSILNSLELLAEFNFDNIVIHDGARPFVTLEEIKVVTEYAQKYGAVTVALPVTDTIKEGFNNIVNKTIDRENLFSIKTPQGFSFSLIYDAHIDALKNNFLGTDDCSLIERLGKDVHIARAYDNNIKITTNIDLVVMSAILNGEK